MGGPVQCNIAAIGREGGSLIGARAGADRRAKQLLREGTLRKQWVTSTACTHLPLLETSHPGGEALKSSRLRAWQYTIHVTRLLVFGIR